MTAYDEPAEPHGILRLTSGVPGLDEVLGGGFLRGGLYIVQGPPGSGKTILANQIAHNADRTGRSVFISVLGESHARMMLHLSAMTFFDLGRIPTQIAYIGAYQALEDDGLKGLLALIRREVQARDAVFMVLDGLSAVEAQAESVFAMKRFAHELQTLASMLNCTMLLLTSASGADGAPERTMVDGIIDMQQRTFGVRRERRLIVHKLRGSAFLEGEHPYRITTEGLAVFPRIEAMLAWPTRMFTALEERVSSGITSLDRMFENGIPAGGMLSVAGPPGSGKTVLGLQFLSKSCSAQPGLMIGCYEPPERLRLKAASVGFDLSAAEKCGDIEVLWQPLGEYILDDIAWRMLDAVRRRGVKRLVIDGLSGFQQATSEPERFVRFWSTLSNELRALGVTTIYTMEMPEIVGPNLNVPVSGISSLAEAMIILRYLELGSRLYRIISLMKVREGSFDPTIRRFTITDIGLVIGEPFEGVEALLTGLAREVPGTVTPAGDNPRRHLPDAG
ncbi:MAG: recombinase RecA [Proteobacteria bacterium]|nr:recombinase RecA [Pseudomonadota bacterium]